MSVSYVAEYNNNVVNKNIGGLGSSINSILSVTELKLSKCKFSKGNFSQRWAIKFTNVKIFKIHYVVINKNKKNRIIAIPTTKNLS